MRRDRGMGCPGYGDVQVCQETMQQPYTTAQGCCKVRLGSAGPVQGLGTDWPCTACIRHLETPLRRGSPNTWPVHGGVRHDGLQAKALLEELE